MLMTASRVDLGLTDGVFDRICVISLASRGDRRRDVTRELARIDLKPGTGIVQFFDAVQPADAGYFPSIGARGCFMSHLSILEQARRDGINALLVLEDDVTFVRDITKRLPVITSLLKGRNWEIFYGGYKETLEEVSVGADQCLVNVDPDMAVCQTHCIGFRGPAIGEAASFLKAISERAAGSIDGGPMHVDGAYSWYRSTYRDRRTLAALPAIAYQRPSRSDIFVEIAWYDRLSFLRRLLLILRRWKHRLLRK